MRKTIKDISTQASDPGKYMKLIGLLFLSFFSFIAALLLLFLFMKFVFGILPYMSWMIYVYMIFIISVPTTLFIFIYSIYFSRTKTFNPKLLRYIFLTIFVGAIICWVGIFISDIISFFKFQKTDIKDYISFDMYLLSGNVAFIFLVGIIQALSAPKKEEWFDKVMRNNHIN